jgi:TonB-linked SusC/RagA family outer membrane protein
MLLLNSFFRPILPVWRIKWIMGFLILLPAFLSAQMRTITGTVKNESGMPLSGISVVVQGQHTGTSTDAAGHFLLNASRGAKLVFSAVGNETREQVIGQSDNYEIFLKPAVSDLGDVVVIGYGSQKKVNLTGSVSTVSSKELENRPVTNISSALAGLSPGMYVSQSSGTPGKDGASITIRGTGTLSSTSVLVLIDGITGSMDDVNPADVESITVLKDAASASIYGALAANGVILVTTKKGTRKRPTISYSGIFSSTNATGLPKFVTNSARYMQLQNESATNIGNSVVFDPTTVIQPFINAQKNPNDTTALGIPNYVAYPNTDWEKVLFQHNLLQNHNVSISGGNENTTYLFSLGYLNNPGLIPNSQATKYQFRANIEAKVGDYITVGTQTFGYLQNYGMAQLTSSSLGLFNYLVQTSPAIYPYYKGKYGSTSASGDVIGQASDLLYYTQNYTGSTPTTNINTTWYAKAKLWKGLTFEPKVNYQVRFDEGNYSDNPVPTERWNFLTMQQVTAPTPASQLNTYNTFTKAWSYTLESVLRYNTTISKVHNIGAIAGFNQYYYRTNSTSITGHGLIDPSVPAISTATSFPSNPTGSATDWAMRSVFGRLTYNYKEKYLLEGNIRRDGSSRFGPNNRYGNFPSVSAGWNLSKESFLGRLDNYNIQNLKIRGSWGQLGNTISVINNSVNNYLWQATYAATNYSYNGIAATGLSTSQIANPNLQWETTTVTDIGLDMTAFRRLNFTFDWYRRFTSGILFQAPQDLTVGTASAPVTNAAQVVNSGVEFSAAWNDKVGQVTMGAMGSFSYNYLNKVETYKGPLQQGWTTDANGNKVYTSNIGAVSAGTNNLIVQGQPINVYYLQTVYSGTGKYTKSDGTVDPNGGPKGGMIRTPQDMTWVTSMIAAGYKFAPVNTTGKGQLYYGDLIYADNNGDGTYGGATDKQFMKVSNTPKYVFGLNLNAAWKGFDLNMIWAGAAGMKYYWNQSYYNSVTVALGGTIPERIADNHYYYDAANPADPNNKINAAFPRIKASDNIDNVASNFWLYNAAYIRLKNLQIGYTIPSGLMGPVGKVISRARIFVSGENLLTITQFPGPDPEIGTSVGYPTMRQYAFGINCTF